MAVTPASVRDEVGPARGAHLPPGDRTRLEMLRGGRGTCAASCASDARVSVVVLAAWPQRATGNAIRSSLAQSHPVQEVLVVGPEWSATARLALEEACQGDARVRWLPLSRPGQAPAEPRARASVRAAQYLRAALPFVSGDWVTVFSEERRAAPSCVAGLLCKLASEGSELAWEQDDTAPAPNTFGGALWAAPLAAMVPEDQPGWSGIPTDTVWWARLIAAGVRIAGTGRTA